MTDGIKCFGKVKDSTRNRLMSSETCSTAVVRPGFTRKPDCRGSSSLLLLNDYEILHKHLFEGFGVGGKSLIGAFLVLTQPSPTSNSPEKLILMMVVKMFVI